MGHRDPVLIENISFIMGKVAQNGTNPLAVKYTRMKSPLGFMNPSSDWAIANTPAGTGPIFIEDCGAEVTVNPGGTMFARQLNSEYTAAGDPNIENRGTLWILGFKTEQGNPAVIIHNERGAKMELLGFYNKPLKSQGDTPTIVNEGALTGAMIKFHIKNVYIEEKGRGAKVIRKNDIPSGDLPLYLAQ